jgi:hypothetical protein
MHIKRYLAGSVNDIGQSIALGVGEKPEAATDTALEYEIGRVSVDLVAYDFDTERLIFKATVTEEFDGVIHEVGLYSMDSSNAGAFGSRILTSFDSETEVWTSAAGPTIFTTENTRVGNDSLTLIPAAGGFVTAENTDVNVDLSENSGADQFSVAFYCADSNLANLSINFYTDSLNYYTVSVPNELIVAGFNIARVAKDAAVASGTPTWSSITSIGVTANAKVAGSATVNLEGIRIEDVDTVDIDYVLVSRAVLDTPFVKVSGRTQDIEFPLEVAISG